jgi:hypothetical protein
VRAQRGHKAHRFYVTQSQIVLVDPQDPKVAEVIG